MNQAVIQLKGRFWKRQKKINHEADATEKVENYQMELGRQNMQNQNKYKRGGVQQKLVSKLNKYDRCCSSMAHYFICSLAHSTFNRFRDEPFLQMKNAVAGGTNSKH